MAFFLLTPDGGAVCPRCWTRLSRSEAISHPCDSGKQNPNGSSRSPLPPDVSRANDPSLATKARNFAASAAKHLAAGMPQATEEQVAERFAICQGCEHFDGKACRKCGCPVVRQKKFLSKLSWANESCPVGKWGPVSS